MRTIIDRRIGQINQTFAARTNLLGQTGERRVVAQFLAPFEIGHRFSLFLALQIAIQRENGLPPDQHCNDDSDGVADVSAIARQIRHQFDKEGKQRKVDKAPDERPPGALALFGKQPAGNTQQRQSQQKTVSKDAQLLAALCCGQLAGSFIFQFAQAVACVLLGLLRIEGSLLLTFNARQRAALGRLEFVQCFGPTQQFTILLGALRRMPGSQPVVEGFPRAERVGPGSVVLQTGLIEFFLGVLRCCLTLLDCGTRLLGGRQVDEVFQRVVALDLGQIFNNRPAQTDQKAGKDKRNQPQAETKPLFRQTQCLAHRPSPLTIRRSAVTSLTAARASMPPISPTSMSSTRGVNTFSMPPMPPTAAARSTTCSIE